MQLVNIINLLSVVSATYCQNSLLEQEELAKKIEEEKKKLATLKQQEEVDEEINIIIVDTIPVNIHSR